MCVGAGGHGGGMCVWLGGRNGVTVALATRESVNLTLIHQ